MNLYTKLDAYIEVTDAFTSRFVYFASSVQYANRVEFMTALKKAHPNDRFAVCRA